MFQSLHRCLGLEGDGELGAIVMNLLCPSGYGLSMLLFGFTGFMEQCFAEITYAFVGV